MSADADTAADLARRIVDDGVSVPALAGDAQRLALARALKAHGDAAWSRDPAGVGRAAEALRALALGGRDPAIVAAVDAAASPPEEASRSSAQIDALADWMAGIAALTRGQMSAAVSSLDRAEARFRALALAGDAAQTQVPKIMALSVLGRHADAAACGERAQRELLALGDVHAASRVSLNLGNLHRRQHALPSAIRCFREAGVLFARQGDRERSVMADIGLADALAAQGDFDEAFRIFARADMRARPHGLPVLEALVQDMSAVLDLARGRYREALAGLEGSRRRYEALSMPQHLATAEKQLADAYLELRLLPEALALFDQAIERFDALEMPVETAWALAQRARTESLLGLPDSTVVDSLQQAAALFAAQNVPVGAATVDLARAKLALSRDDADAAADFAERAARVFDAAAVADGQARAEVVHAHARLLQGHADEARRRLTATLARAERLQLLPVQVRCRTVLGLVALALRGSDGDDAAAREHFEAAITLFEDQRSALPGDDLRSAFQSEHLRPYQELLRLALARDAAAPSPLAAGDVFRALERFRARSLGERLGDAQGHDAAAITGASPDRPTEAAGTGLRARVNWLHRLLQRMQDDGEAAPPALTEQLRRAERELLEHARRERIADAGAHAAADTVGALTDKGTDAFSLAALQQALHDDEALVEYGVQGDELFACLVRRHDVVLQRRLAPWPEVAEAVRALRFQLDALRHGAAAVQRHLPVLTQRAQARLSRLHALVWAPLAPRLSDVRRVLVVPHEQLASVPFAALHDGSAFLAESLAVAVAPSARVAWHGLTRPATPPHSVLALGEATRLVHAADEARFVAGLFAQSRVLVGVQASSEALRALAGTADVIHLACHAQFRADNPMFSALQLTDGPLTVEMTEQLNLRRGIVTLSACETGLAEHSRGDESVGLVRAFLVAGAARVVASLWPVDDAVTSRFMAHFYTALQAGHSASAGLQAAQHAVRATHPHPFYWAAFSLHGGW